MCADCSIIKTDDAESYKTENHEIVHSQTIRGTNVDTVVDEPEVTQDHVPQPFKFNFVSDPEFMRDIFIDIHVNDDEFLYDDGTKCKIELAKVLHTHEDDHLEANQPTLLLSRPQNNLICCKNMRFDVQDPLAFQAGQRTNVVVDKQDFPWRMEHVTPPVSETVSWIDVHEPSYVWLPNFVLSSPSECSVAASPTCQAQIRILAHYLSLERSFRYQVNIARLFSGPWIRTSCRVNVDRWSRHPSSYHMALINKMQLLS